MDQTPPAPTPPHAPHGAGGRRIVREPDDRKIAGVCSGLADHLGIDVAVMRVTAVVLAIVTPAALIAYLVASVAIPERRPDQPRVRARHVHLGQVPHPLIAVGAVVAVAVLIDDAWWLDPFPAAVALVGIGVWLVVQNRDEAVTYRPDPPYPAEPTDAAGGADQAGQGDASHQDGPPADAPTVEHPMASSPWLVSVSQHSDTVGGRSTTLTDEDAPHLSEPQSREGAGPSGEFPPPASPWWSGSPAAPPPPSPSPQPVVAPPRRHRSRLGSVVLALLLIGGGTLWLLAGLDVFTVDAEDALALGLLVVGAGLLVTSWRGRGYALIPVGFLLAGTLVAVEAIDVPLRAGTGERTVVVDTADDLRTRHELLAGDLTVDITDAPLPAGRTTEVAAAVGMGELNVVVPRDVVVEVNATTGAGEVTSPGGPEANETGFWVDTTFTLDAAADGPDAPDAADGASAGSAGSDPPRLTLDLDVGVGAIEVTRG